MRTAILALALLLPLAMSSPVSAGKGKMGGKEGSSEIEEETDPEIAEAIEHFTNGVEFFEKGNFEAALVEFVASYEINPAWELRYNIGICHDEMGEPVQAMEWLSLYLEEGGPDVPDDRAGEVKQLVDRLEEKVASLALSVEPEDAVVMVGGENKEVVSGKPVLLNPGIHEVVVSKDGHEPYETKITLVSGERKGIEVKLEKIEKPPPPTDEPKPVLKLSWPGLYIGAGAAGVLAIAASITGGLVLASKKKMLDAADDCENTTSSDTCPEAYDYRDRAQGLKIATNVLWALAGAALVTGVVLMLTGQPDLDKEDGGESMDEPEEGLDALDVSLSPLLAPGQGGMLGLELGVTF